MDGYQLVTDLATSDDVPIKMPPSIRRNDSLPDQLQHLLILDESVSDADPTSSLAAANSADDRKLDLRLPVLEPCWPADHHPVTLTDDGISSPQTCHPVHWKIRSRDDLLSLSNSTLNSLLERLHLEVEEISATLVLALQERHRLQEEVDIRFIAIEQLLKVPGKLLCRPIDPLTLTPLTKVDALECQ